MAGQYVKRHRDWVIFQEDLDKRPFDGFPREREIWWCALGVNVGSEQDGTTDSFERPVLIVKKIRRELVLIIPFTSKVNDEPNRIPTESTGIPSDMLIDQMRTISSKRLMRKMGYLKANIFLRTVIDMTVFILEAAQIETPPDGGESRSPKAKVP